VPLSFESPVERIPQTALSCRLRLYPGRPAPEPVEGEGDRAASLRFYCSSSRDLAGERVTLECTRQTSRTIWEMARQRFHAANLLSEGWIVTQAKLTIKFNPNGTSRRGRTLPLTITMPHGCDLKDRIQQSGLLGTNT
jgi:hypothetical protein